MKKMISAFLVAALVFAMIEATLLSVATEEAETAVSVPAAALSESEAKEISREAVPQPTEQETERTPVLSEPEDVVEVFSDEKSVPAATGAGFALATPTVTKIETVKTGAKLTWGKVDGAAAYRVFMKKGKVWEPIDDTTATSYVHIAATTGTAITYTVRCLGSDGKYNSDFNREGWTNTVLATPEITKIQPVYDNEQQRIKITWKKVAGAELFRVFQKNGSAWKKLGDTAETSFVGGSGFVSGENYIFTVRCVSKSDAAFQSWYNEDGVSLPFVSYPDGVKIENGNNTQKISWNASPGAVKYRVFVRASGAWKALGDTAATAFTHTGKTAGASYLYTVRCLDKNGDYSSTFYPYGYAKVYVSMPTGLKVTNLEGGQKITWTAQKGASKYRVFLKNGSGWKKLADTTSDYTYTAVKGGESYTYTVRCLDNAGTYCSAYNANGVTERFIASPDVTSIENTFYGMRVKWNAPTGATAYRLFYKGGSITGWTAVGDTTANTMDLNWDFQNLVSGTKYSFAVRALSKVGGSYVSEFVHPVKTYTYLTAPYIRFTSNASNGMIIQWDKIAGVTTYRLFLRDGSKWVKFYDTTNTKTTYIKAKSGTTYTFTVRGMDKNGKYITGFDPIGHTATYYSSSSVSHIASFNTTTIQSALEAYGKQKGMTLSKSLSSKTGVEYFAGFTGFYGDNTGFINDFIVSDGKKEFDRIANELTAMGAKLSNYQFEIKTVKDGSDVAFYIHIV